MKWLPIVLFLFLFSLAHAEIGIVWDQTYDDLGLGSIEQIIPLASGDYFIVHKTEVDGHRYPHATIVDEEGTILDTFDFAGPLARPTTFSVRPSFSGGALAAVLTTEETWLYRFSSSGELLDSYTIPRGPGREMYDMIQKPDGSLIFSGDLPDLISVDPDTTVEWFHNFDGNGNETTVINMVRRHSGDFLCIYTEEYYGFADVYHAVFTEDGQVLYIAEGGYNTPRTIAGRFDDALLSLSRGYDIDDPDVLWKWNSWSLDLPGFPGESESYRDLQPFNGKPGYFCTGGHTIDLADIHGLFLEVSEDGVLLDSMEISSFTSSECAAMMNGDMLVVGYRVNSPTDRDPRIFRVTTGDTHLPVSMDIWLYNTPLWIATNGGYAHYRLLIGNDLDTPANVTVQFTLENASLAETVAAEYDVVLQPHEPIVVPNARLFIPGDYPEGQYILRAKVFDEDAVLLSQCIQTFKKAYDRAVSSPTVEPGFAANVSTSPNPFNAATTISVTLPETAALTIRVFDVQGRTVATLADGRSLQAGTHAFSFDGSNLASGLYFVQASVPGKLNEVQKLVLVK